MNIEGYYLLGNLSKLYGLCEGLIAPSDHQAKLLKKNKKYYIFLKFL